MRHLPLALFMGLASVEAHAFAFLCNGVDADNRPIRDGCNQSCSAATAARWEPPQVDFRFDDNVRPREETLSEWQTHQTQTMAAWNNVSGHTLTLRDAGAASFRVYGSINGENSIFWITSTTEFQNQVRASPNSALGVTLASYDCGSGGGRRGPIRDADIVMNGTGAFNWDQNSVVSTMAHEVGHAIGFGHPCTGCSHVALMSATSGLVESDVPLFDDQEAIRALYPGSPGGLGTACTSDGQCTSGPCVTVPINGTNRSFCSQTCTTTCPNGMTCATVAGEGDVCVFANAGIARPGDACGPPGCVDECTSTIGPGCNVCLDNGNDGSSCFAGCVPSSGAGCGANEGCVPFGCSNNSQCGAGGTCTNGACTNIGVCVAGGTALRGQACGRDIGCVAGVTCVTDSNGNNGVCLGLCDGNGRGCLSTESCLYLFTGETNTGACFPAGTGVEGDRCSDFDECGRGLICLGGTCAQRCDRGFSCGDASQTCRAISGGNGMQFCSPVGAEGEGEGEGEGENRGCDGRRGNFDCPVGQRCEDGECVPGEGEVALYGLCERNSDCADGLCENGACTNPCDIDGGCPGGYRCEEDAIPGGLCVPESCRENEGICDEGFTCAYSPAQRYVCARGVAGGICNCTTTGDAGAAPWSGLALVGIVGGLLRRRRRPA
jgi:MYXO-CTERM domain-containing protein